MSLKKKQLFLIIIFLFLVGCASMPENLGINELEWTSYSPKKQRILLEKHAQISKERELLTKVDENLGDTFLAVKVYGGKVMFPPLFLNWQNYKPMQFNIFNGRCQKIDLVSQASENIKTQLGVCFLDDVLYLDPSRYDFSKKLGSVNIYFSPLWTSGFSYKGINSTGYVQLNDVTVEIKKHKIPAASKTKK